jgi:hypothetical protein
MKYTEANFPEIYTPDWDKMCARRFYLINKYYDKNISEKEKLELDILDKLTLEAVNKEYPSNSIFSDTLKELRNK